MHLNTLSFENMGNWPWLIKLVFAASIIFLFFIMFYFYDIKPLHKKINNEKKLNNQLSISFQKKNHEANTLTTYQQQAKQIDNDNFLLLKQLPRAWNVSQIIQALSKLGNHRGLNFKAIKPQTEVIQSNYIILPIHISVEGSYYQLGRFVADIAQLKPIVTIDNFTIQMITNNQSSSMSQINLSHQAENTRITHNKPLQMSFTAHMYRQNTSIDTTISVANIPIIPVNPLPAMPEPSVTQYNHSVDFSPFNPPIAANNIPSINPSDSTLQRYPLSALIMVGTLMRDSQIWALIAAPDGQVLRVNIGDKLGLEKNRILRITSTEVTLEANSTSNANTVASALLYLRLNTHMKNDSF